MEMIEKVTFQYNPKLHCYCIFMEGYMLVQVTVIFAMGYWYLELYSQKYELEFVAQWLGNWLIGMDEDICEVETYSCWYYFSIYSRQLF